MVDDIDDTCKIFAHICFDIVWTVKKLRNTIVKVGCDDSFRIALNGTFRGDYGIHGGIALARPVPGDSVCDYFGCTICSLGTDLSL